MPQEEKKVLPRRRHKYILESPGRRSNQEKINGIEEALCLDIKNEGLNDEHMFKENDKNFKINSKSKMVKILMEENVSKNVD